MKSAVALVVLTALAAVVALPAAAPAPPAKDGKARQKTAKALVDWAGWCARNGAAEEGRAALTEARGLQPDAGAAVETELDAAEDAADDEALARGRKLHGPKIAKAYDALAGVSHADDEADRFAGYRLRALAWDASKARGKKTAKWIGGLDDPGRAARAIGGAWEAAGDGEAAAAITSVVAKEAGGLVLVGTASHPLVAFVSLPKGWKKGRTYPVLVGVDGAGSNFAGYGKSSTSARGSRDVIGVYPMTLSSTNALSAKKYPHYPQSLLDRHGGVAERLAFDLAGVNAILTQLTRHAGADERAFLTGFSGGGQFTYLKLLQEPAKVRGAVPCCANFGGGGLQDAPGAGDGGGPPVLLLTGENDKHREFTHGNKDMPGIEPQTDHAQKALADLGYTHVERRMVKAGHSPLHAEVWKFVDSVMEKR